MPGKSDNPYRVTLPDGSRLIRNTRMLDDGTVEPYGNWFWQVYDPDRRPTRKKVNLYTHDKAGAYAKAMEYVRQRGAGLYDPWHDAAKQAGTTIPEAAERYLAMKDRAG